MNKTEDTNAADCGSECNAVLGAWQPIETAPEGRLVVVGWLDGEDAELPERHDFDWLEGGCWTKWHDHAEHAHMVGGYGVSYTPPYTHWLDLPAIPKAPNAQVTGAAPTNGERSDDV